jgi:hypothetical protein
VFRNNVEGHYGQTGAGYLYDTDFQTACLEEELTAILISRMISHLLVKLKGMHLHYMAHNLVLVEVVQVAVSSWENGNKQDGIWA